MDLAAAHQIVLHVGWLSRTPPLFQRDVLDRCHLQRFKGGESICMVGDPPGGMYGLVSGGLGISIAPGERGFRLGAFARPGAWFGETAAITDQPRRFGMTATRDSELLHLPLHGVHEIVGKDLGAWRYIALVTIGHLEMAIGACDDLMIRDYGKRCVAILLRLGGCRHASPDSAPVEIDLSQEDLAELANVARTSVGAVLRKLESMGYLAQCYRRIRILEPGALRTMLKD